MNQGNSRAKKLWRGGKDIGSSRACAPTSPGERCGCSGIGTGNNHGIFLPSHPQTLLARALYDNCADCSEELAFSRGDILTILEQNVPESEGWWKCLLHGRQGLAPANRLQILTEAPTDRPCPPLLRGLEETLASSEDTHMPTLLKAPPSGPIYEQMKSWVEAPLPPTIQVYEFPDPPACARIVCEKTVSIPRQVSMLPNEEVGQAVCNTQALTQLLNQALTQLLDLV